MSELILYRSEDGQTRLHLRADGETVWLSQLEIAELFQNTKQNVSLHAKNIFADGELQQDSVVKESLTTAADGKNYRTQLYNLDLSLNFWRDNVDKILAFNDQPILDNAGSVSREEMEQIAHQRYALFDQQRQTAAKLKADDDDLKEIESLEYDLKHSSKPS